nr:NADH dehydrogenase subunit 2 [Euwallacea fornicatus]
MFKFFKLLFLMTLILGSIISISSVSWFYSWLGLEINLLSFIILMKTPSNKYSSESISKYFMTQAMASFILLFSIMVFMNSLEFNFELNYFSSIMASSAILMKMGAAPLHFWFPEVASGISWNMNFLLLTWQKVAPMILLTYLMMIPNMMILFIITSGIVGSIMGLNQVCLRKILAYSSINHIGWMLASIMCSTNLWMIYILVYSMMNLVIINMLKYWKIFSIPQMNKIKNNLNKILVMMNFLSLGGLPPFPGFIPKWMVISSLSKSLFFFLTFFMIIFTLITLFFYLRITFSSMTLYTNNSMMMNNSYKLFPSMLALLTFTPVVFLSMMLM